MKKNKIFNSDYRFLGSWLLIYFILIALTLNNTRPYEGDESFYTVSALNMVKSNNYIIPEYFGNMRFQKPILPYWIVVAGYKLAGIGFIGARIPFLLMATATLFLVFKFSLLIMPDHKYADLNVVLLSSSYLFLSLSRIAMTDLPLTFFMTLSLYYFFKSLKSPYKLKTCYFIAYISMGLAFLSKGFFGFFPFFAMLLYLLYKKPDDYKRYILQLFNPVNLITLILISFSWYLIVYIYYYDAFMSQMQRESANTLTSFTIESIFFNVIFYAGKLITNYFPFTLVAGFLYFKNRKKISLNSSYLLVYSGIILMVLIFTLQMHKARYLLIIFPVLTMIMGKVFYMNYRPELIKKIAISLVFIKAVVFIFYPAISGEAVKELVLYWKKHEQGEFAAYDLGRKQTGWAYLVADGRMKHYHEGIEYIITRHDNVDKFKKYEIIRESQRVKKIALKEFKLQKKMEKYYLLKRIE